MIFRWTNQDDDHRSVVKHSAAAIIETMAQSAKTPSRALRAEGVPHDSARYDDIWRRAVALYPDYETYKTRTARQIPIVELVAQQAVPAAASGATSSE